MFVRKNEGGKREILIQTTTKQSFIDTCSMQSNNASAETSSCPSSDLAQRRSTPPPPPPPPPRNEVGPPVPRLEAMSTPTFSLRQILSLQQPQNPTLMLWIDDSDGTVTTRLPLFQFPHLTSPLVQQYQHQSDVSSRMVYLKDVLGQALDICNDVDSIITSEQEDTAHRSTSNGEDKQ